MTTKTLTTDHTQTAHQPSPELPEADYWRQLGIVTPKELEFPITVIGVGGIGNPVTLLLAKMGCSQITVMDFDNVKPHNRPSTFYRGVDCGRLKVTSLAEIVHSFTDLVVTAQNERFEDQALSGVVITCVDNMESRRKIWQKARLNIQIPLLIDARMGGQTGLVLAVNPCRPEHIRAYEGLLYTSEEALEIPCTEQSIIYNTFAIAWVIGVFIKCFAKHQPLPLNGIVKVINTDQLVLH